MPHESLGHRVPIERIGPDNPKDLPVKIVRCLVALLPQHWYQLFILEIPTLDDIRKVLRKFRVEDLQFIVVEGELRGVNWREIHIEGLRVLSQKEVQSKGEVEIGQ
jgi:hypothetical protein